MAGKKTIDVNPWMTSQNDCRGLKRGERKGGLYIGVDGVFLNADINAACNIAWKATMFGYNNPIVPKKYERNGGQAEVTQPNIAGSNSRDDEFKSSEHESVSESCKVLGENPRGPRIHSGE